MEVAQEGWKVNGASRSFYCTSFRTKGLGPGQLFKPFVVLPIQCQFNLPKASIMNKISAIVAMSARPGLHVRIQNFKRSGLTAAIPRSHFYAAPRAAFSHRCGLETNFADSSPTDEPKHCSGSSSEPNEYWKKVKVWSNVTAKDFMSYRWQVGRDQTNRLVTVIVRC